MQDRKNKTIMKVVVIITIAVVIIGILAPFLAVAGR